MPIVWGIDPGKKGALCIMQDGVIKEIIRFEKNTPRDIVDILKSQRTPDWCYLEKVGSMPGQGVASTFVFGEAFGWIQGVLDALAVPYGFLTPIKWQRGYNLPPKSLTGATEHKRALKEVAQRLYPSVKFTADMADAVLIARHAYEYVVYATGGQNAKIKACPFD